MSEQTREMREAERRGNIVRLVFHKLGPEYSPCDCPSTWGFVFGISRRAPQGHRFASGQKHEFQGGPKIQQFNIICQTSSDDEEAAERIIQLVIHKNDTTRLAALAKQNFNEQSIKEMVAKAVADALKTHVDELVRDQSRIDKIAEMATNTQIIRKMDEAKAPAPEPEPKPERPADKVRRGLQERPKRKSKEEYGAAIDEENKMWEDRAQILGMDKPIYRTRDRRIDRRWIRRAQANWDQHCKGEPQQA